MQARHACLQVLDLAVGGLGLLELLALTPLPDQEPRHQVMQYLKDRTILMVLNCLEQIPNARGLVRELLDRVGDAPDVAAMVGSPAAVAGIVDRGLAVLEVQSRGDRILDPAPTTFQLPATN